ncbi:FixH family protein [Halomonas sp. ML-15]|uniref:FixH family protein n=1 Tax=Halomonas sp. ML-15 TaxID=2773305 RepID=UPI001745D235|nr:FixH family protein [Halomonas sp. ML-15]MBD3894779.1 FixH family protein [Halomonas sp. ML-15]
MSTIPVTPWYKQFWPWLLLGLLFTSITASCTLAVMAIRSADGMVQEDYYEHGRAINMVLAKQQRAAELELVGDLRIDDQTGDITLELAGDDRPERLILQLLFPTRDDRDQTFTLEHVRDGRYIGQAEERLNYRWYLQLQPDHETPEWRLSGEATFPVDDAISLAPGGPG